MEYELNLTRTITTNVWEQDRTLLIEISAVDARDHIRRKYPNRTIEALELKQIACEPKWNNPEFSEFEVVYRVTFTD